VKALFWTLLFLYTGVSVWRHVRGGAAAPRPDRFRALGLQTPLLAVALWIAVERGALSRDLLSPWGIAAGFACGYLIHAASLMVTNATKDLRGILRALRVYFFGKSRRGAVFADQPGPMFALFQNSVVEEVIFRAVAQTLLIAATGRVGWSVLAVAVLFSLGHEHFLRRPRIESIEFLGYAVALGALYYWTGSLILVIVAHTVRNFELQYQQHLIRIDAARRRKRAVILRVRRRSRVARSWNRGERTLRLWAHT